MSESPKFITITDMAHAFDDEFAFELTDRQKKLEVGDHVLTTMITGSPGFGRIVRSTPFTYCFIEFTTDGLRWWVRACPKHEVIKISRWDYLQGLTRLPEIGEDLAELAKQNVKETIDLNIELQPENCCPECKGPMIMEFTTVIRWVCTMINVEEKQVTQPDQVGDPEIKLGKLRCTYCKYETEFDPRGLQVKKGSSVPEIFLG